MKSLKRTCITLSTVFAAACADAEQAPSGKQIVAKDVPIVGQEQSRKLLRLRREDRIIDVLNHPAFAGFSRLLLPWDDRAYDGNMPLTAIGTLLPYHSQVEPSDVVAGMNRMIDEVNQGKTVFYDFYTTAQKEADPTKRNTGLFFFRGRPGAPFAVVAPGGGFSYVGSVHEGFPYATEISRRGFNAFVIKYRVGQGGTAAAEDLAVAVDFLFRNAVALQIDTNGYSLWGSSAGARMAANVGSYGTARYGGGEHPKPSTVVMAYTAHETLASAEPPTFVVVGQQDGIAPPEAMEKRVSALRAQGTLVEYHKYPNVAHGFGLGTGTSAQGWLGEATRFWENNNQRSGI